MTDEFIALSRKEGRSADEDRHLAVLKQEMADRLLAKPAAEVYDLAWRELGSRGRGPRAARSPPVRWMVR